VPCTQYLINQSLSICFRSVELQPGSRIVCRFNIHENKRNVDDLLISALLHHDSVIFVKIVQIISLDSDAHKKWYWLKPSAVGVTGDGKFAIF
jgi:hypothetical protein